MLPADPPSPAHALAAHCLTGRRTTLGAHIPPKRYRLAIAAAGSGLDHLVGEVAVALTDQQLDQDAFTDGILFTDRRLVGRSDGNVVDLPYPALENATSSTGVLLDDLHLTAWGRLFKLSGIPDVQAAASFLMNLIRVHPAQRVPPPRLLPAPSAGDPTGGLAARASMWSGDVRVLPLVGLALEGHQKGWFSAEIGADHVARAMLYDRTLAYGRGAHERWWTSPMGAADLIYAFSRMLGQPLAVRQEGQVRVLDFRFQSRGSVAGAAASSAVGLVALGVLGVGWVSRPGQSSLDVRVSISPGLGSTGFSLMSGRDSLSLGSSSFVASLFDILPRIEGRMLLLRAAFGWDAPPEHLDNLPMEAVYQRVAEAIGPLEIRIFYPEPPRR